MINSCARYFSSATTVKRVGVLGAGQMGTGIGIVASRVANLDVTFVDPGADSLKKSEDFVKKWCQKEISKERMTAADMDSVLSRINWSHDISAL